MNTLMTGGKVPVVDMKRTGENIARLRKAAGLSVRDIQIVMGFNSPQAIYSWQNGSYLPTVDNLIILASVFGTTLDEIVAVGEDENILC